MTSLTIHNNPLIETCRMPYFESDDEVRELQMAECDLCHQWYHRSCISVPDYVFKQKTNFGFVHVCGVASHVCQSQGN